MSEQSAGDTEHLRCTGCGDNIAVAKKGGDVLAVCHCTHDDGEIDPIPVAELNIFHAARWEFVGGRSVGAETEQGGST